LKYFSGSAFVSTDSLVNPLGHSVFTIFGIEKYTVYLQIFKLGFFALNIKKGVGHFVYNGNSH
jgi:hypothetical protein